MAVRIATDLVEAGRFQPAVSESVVNVLVVDDEEDQFVLVRRLLAPFSSPRFSVVWADSYSSGLVQLERGRFDVCLVDYRLGQMNGVELIAEARIRHPEVPFILATGRGDRDVDMEAMAAGATDYLSKARIDGPTLERAIRYATTEQALLNEVQRDRDHVEALDLVSQILALEGPSIAGLDRVLEVLDSRLGHNCSAIYLLGGDRLTLGAVHGFVTPTTSTPADSGPLGRVMKEGHPMIVPTWSDSDDASHTGCEYTMPLTFEDRRVGILTVAVSADQQIDDRAQRALREIANRVGNAMGLHQERSWLAERGLALRRATTFVDAAMHEPSGPDQLDRLLTRLEGAFVADGFAIAMTGRDGRLVVRSACGSLAERLGDVVGPAHSPAARARDRQIVQVDSTGMSCAAFVPVLAGSELVGLLWVDRLGLASTFSPLETEVLALLGAQLGSVIELRRVRAEALSSGVRNETTGLFTRSFFDALMSTYGLLDHAAQGSFGLVIAAPRNPDQTSLEEEQETLRCMIRVALAHVAGGPDVVAHYGAASLAIFVRERAASRTATLASELAHLSMASGSREIAVGWAVRPAEAVGSLVTATEMALEVSRRTRTEVEA